MTSTRNLALCYAACWIVLASVSQAQSPAALAADIAPQPLRLALAAFAQQTDLQLVYVSAIAETQQTKGARAGQSLSEALTALLEHTGLRFEFLNARTVRIFAPPGTPSTSTYADAAARRSARPGAKTAFGLEEVVVTATRRDEKADRVPISLAVWTQADMDASGIAGMAEIAALTPGVEFDFDAAIGSSGYTNLVIRGVTDRHGVTTAVFYDDIPVPTARGDTYGRSFPWTFDLNRVEVLRGPQGMQLGQGALGGAVRFITNQPSLTTTSALARTEVSTTTRGAASYEVGAALGGPLVGGVLGFRVSGWYRTEGGYVDRINRFTGATIESNVNRQRAKSARLALTWAPLSALRITPSLDYEAFGAHDSPAFYSDLSDLQNGDLRSGSLLRLPYDVSFYLAAVKLQAGVGHAELNVVSSYFDQSGTIVFDVSPEDPGSYADAAANLGKGTQHMFAQEVRLASAGSDASFNWMAGIFYSKGEGHDAYSVVDALGAVSGANATVIGQSRLESFGEVDFGLPQHLRLNVGTRIGHSNYDATTAAAPVFSTRNAESWQTPRVGLSYRPDAHNYFYLTAAKGYRSGGVYGAVFCGDAAVFPSDSVWSYEIGAKDDLRNGWLHLEASLFHVTWYNDQPEALYLTGCGTTSTWRASAASNGVDFSASVLMSERLRMGLEIEYADAHYTQTLNVGGAVVVRSGDAVGAPPRVPSPLTVAASVDYRLQLGNSIAVILRADDSFHGHNPGPFTTDNPESPFYVQDVRADPAMNVLNLRGSARWPHVDLGLFVDNALDARPTLALRPNVPGSSHFQAVTIRPRTIGVSATWRL